MARRRRSYPLPCLVDDIVDDSVLLSLLRIHDEVAFHIFFHFFQLLPGVLGQQLIRNLAHAQNFARVDVDIGRLTADKPPIDG